MSESYIDRVAALIRDHTPADLLPDDGDDSDDLFRLYALLTLSHGSAVTGEQVHDAWSVWMLNRGEQHESIVPFHDLDADTRDQDQPFVAAIRSAAASLGR